jgi:hypothetical protein
MMPDKTLPPSIKRALDRSKERKSVAPVPGAREARQAIQGYIGMDPSYSVMDPEAQSLSSAYRSGEAASVLGDLAGALSPLAMASAAAKANQLPGIAELIAYHGSPHKFKKFDASKIGTGEGIGAYGHGLYFAENPNVASEYRRKLSALTNLVDGDVSKSNIDAIVGRQIQALGANKAKQYFLQSADQYERMGQSYKPALETAAKYRAFADHVDQLSSKSFAQNKGSLYKVNIPDEKIAQMLDWDKPLSQQSDVVKRAVLGREIVDPELLYKKSDEYLKKGDATSAEFVKRQAFALENDLKRTGEGWYQTLASQQMPSTGDLRDNMQKGSAAAAQALRDAGIPGIRYLDQGSRGTGKGTSNFVVFPGEEESIKMLDINGEPQMAAGGAVSMQNNRKVHISDNPDTMLLELMSAPRMQDGGSTDQFFGRTAPRGVSSLPGYGQGKEDVQQAITALEESPVGRIAAGAGELAEGYMSGAGSTDLQKIGQGLSMIPMLGLPATVAKTTRAAKAVKPVAEIATDIKPKFKAPQDKALQEAQRNAALPVEQGGLGLPPDNTADMRAAAMNYQDYYHGTERLDRLLEKEALDPRRATSGPMPFGAGETGVASRYAMSKRDTSRLAGDEGNVADYFTVSAKDLGSRSKADVPVEKAFYFLPREKQQEIISKMSRIGYENPREATGDIVLHPEGTVGTIVDPKTIDYYMKREAKGNPLTALRMIWHDSGTLYNNEEQLAKVFELAGFPLPISQKNAPWSSAQGVLTGKARLDKPLITTDTAAIEQQVIPALKQAFAKDRTRKKPYGPDQWAKDVRYTPKEWVDELEKDMIEGKNSYVWTSIPDKVTSELRKLGFDGILDVGGKGGGSEYRVVIPFDTKQVRSRFAAFDPKNKDKPGLLKAKGGKVHISNNPDTMRLELLRKKHG